MQEQKTKKRRTKKKKFKAIHLVPVIFLLIVIIVGFSLFQSLFQKGPVYGERCAGITEVSQDSMASLQSTIKQDNSSIEKILIEVKCKTFAIDLKLSDGLDKDTITEICENVLVAIDEKVSLSKSNSESKYSDLFGTYNGKTQYHVDFTIEGNDGIYPIFASKHPNSDSINFTYNEAINPDLADELANPSTDE